MNRADRADLADPLNRVDLAGMSPVVQADRRTGTWRPGIRAGTWCTRTGRLRLRRTGAGACRTRIRRRLTRTGCGRART